MATAQKTTKKVAAKKAAPKKTPAKKTTSKKVAKKPAEGSFAVIATGGKQYLVRVGDIISVEKLDGTFAAGDTLSFDQVLLKDNGSSTELGTPTIKGAVVVAEFIEAGRGKKIDVIQYKQKSRYYKKKGHRQPFMKFKISEIK
jgi:large subunit ribosomal protein L21